MVNRDVDAPDRRDQVREALEVRDEDVVDPQMRKYVLLEGLDEQAAAVATAGCVCGIQLRLPYAGNVDREVAWD